ncbi:winged helix-turn-helix transcriptional regulator [Actinophytocola sp.]|uniref:winged helix-turn-helix transcriptional regulator n=1 Tax=Actinophytocola sp. TaxID=1872138 RepID=UPI003D6BA961
MAARALDVVGERWPLVIVQELFKRPHRYSEPLGRLPGIGTSVLADRLRMLERAAVVAREPGPVGGGVVYTLTKRARRWTAHCASCAGGVSPSSPTPPRTARPTSATTSPTSKASTTWPTASSSSWSTASRPPCASPTAGSASNPVRRRAHSWAAGEVGWDDGRATGEVSTAGPGSAWPRWLAATGYLRTVAPDTAQEADQGWYEWLAPPPASSTTSAPPRSPTPASRPVR